MLFEKKIIGFYKQKLFSRCDDMGLARYFTHKDFPGLQAEPFSFKDDAGGNTLRGNFYSYPNYREDRIVVFDHGMGGGHLSYMREIEMLAKHFAGRMQIGAGTVLREAQVALYGHTHREKIDLEYGMHFINPGSVGERGQNRSAYAEILVEDNGFVIPSLVKWE